jgi:hypothetical protein
VSDIQHIGDQSPFDTIRRVRPDGTEYWTARDLCQVVEYETWRNFAAAVERAKIALKNSGEDVTSHVVDAGTLVQRPQGGSVPREDYELSRHGAYITLMNGDPSKPRIAEAHNYFARRTRQAEVVQMAITAEDRAIKRLAVLQAAKGLIDSRHLEAKARCQLAIGLGEAPELDVSCRPLYSQTYLEERGLSRKQIKALSGMFGKRLKAAFLEQHGTAPKQYPLETGSGQIRNVNAYTEADRSLMDAVWDRFYAGVAV